MFKITYVLIEMWTYTVVEMKIISHCLYCSLLRQKPDFEPFEDNYICTLSTGDPVKSCV